MTVRCLAPGARSRRGSPPRSSRRRPRADRRGRGPSARAPARARARCAASARPRAARRARPRRCRTARAGPSASSSTCASRAASRMRVVARLGLALVEGEADVARRRWWRRGRRPAGRSRRLAHGRERQIADVVAVDEDRARSGWGGGARGASRWCSCPSRSDRRSRSSCPRGTSNETSSTHLPIAVARSVRPRTLIEPSTRRRLRAASRR